MGRIIIDFTQDFVLQGTVPVQPTIEPHRLLIRFPPNQPEVKPEAEGGTWDNIRLQSIETFPKIQRALCFYAQFVTAPVSLYEYDQFSIFWWSIHGDAAVGDEFGVHCSLKNNLVSAYVGGGPDRKLFINEGKMHHYRVEALAKETVFYVDGKMAARIDIGSESFSDYQIRLLGHRKRDGGDYDGSPYYMVCEDLSLEGFTPTPITDLLLSAILGFSPVTIMGGVILFSEGSKVGG